MEYNKGSSIGFRFRKGIRIQNHIFVLNSKIKERMEKQIVKEQWMILRSGNLKRAWIKGFKDKKYRICREKAEKLKHEHM